MIVTHCRWEAVAGKALEHCHNELAKRPVLAILGKPTVSPPKIINCCQKNLHAWEWGSYTQRI